MSAAVQFSDAGKRRTIHALERPASEKRQGTKSRGVGAPGECRAMGIWRQRERWRRLAETAAPVALAGSLGVGSGVNERNAGCCT